MYSDHRERVCVSANDGCLIPYTPIHGWHLGIYRYHGYLAGTAGKISQSRTVARAKNKSPISSPFENWGALLWWSYPQLTSVIYSLGRRHA